MDFRILLFEISILIHFKLICISRNAISSASRCQLSVSESCRSHDSSFESGVLQSQNWLRKVTQEVAPIYPVINQSMELFALFCEAASCFARLLIQKGKLWVPQVFLAFLPQPYTIPRMRRCVESYTSHELVYDELQA